MACVNVESLLYCCVANEKVESGVERNDLTSKHYTTHITTMDIVFTKAAIFGTRKKHIFSKHNDYVNVWISHTNLASTAQRFDNFWSFFQSAKTAINKQVAGCDDVKFLKMSILISRSKAFEFCQSILLNQRCVAIL